MNRSILRFAKRQFLKALTGLEGGFLEVVCPEATYTYGDPSSELRAMAVIHDERFFLKAVTGADIGIGEAYMNGDWTSPDLVSLVRLATRNLRRLDAAHPWLSAVRRFASRFGHWLHDNDLRGSRENIRAHYDLGNDFYRLFLDQGMLYSSAYFVNCGESLEQAQRNKMDVICRKLQIEPGDRVLEIGCGWGAFSVFAAQCYGAHVTGLTLSASQFEVATQRVADADLRPGSAEILLQDYRQLEGSFDKIVSIEMFEAVGLAHYDEFFSTCDRLLAPEGSMLLQTITIREQELKKYRRRVDWIQAYIFPGSELAFLGEIQKSLARATSFTMAGLESFGQYYARTLAQWRENFFRRLADVQALGFDERFQRMWDFYLSWCEGAFREKYINVVHLLCEKQGFAWPRELAEVPKRALASS
ncbi:MAG TPA: cyclopropane-fatty-acyl-phospholipid synthase family protein [Methylomirabilota bacterium]|nr:cyclopropane-fatty-acyl-phospholipid synthase family protein [Methylomirabilota bacterium]